MIFYVIIQAIIKDFKVKRIGIMTTGGDCSGLNATIGHLTNLGISRGFEMIGLIDGTDGLATKNPKTIKLGNDTLPEDYNRLSGSMLRNGCPGSENFNSAVRNGTIEDFQKRIKHGLDLLKLDALVLIGGNGSISMAYKYREIYSKLQLVCIPKTIDMDIPITDVTIGFQTAVQQMTTFCDQLLMTARSHHRWFVVQSMGRNVGMLALHSGISTNADAILIPEIKFKTENLISHIKNIQKNKGRDYGIIIVSEGIKIRGHSGEPADMIHRELTRAGISSRASYPEHFQRVGDTTAPDKILAAQMSVAAIEAIENNETFVMVSKQSNDCKTVPMSEMFERGEITSDPNIPGVSISNAYVSDDHPLLSVAANLGIYIGEIK